MLLLPSAGEMENRLRWIIEKVCKLDIRLNEKLFGRYFPVFLKVFMKISVRVTHVPPKPIRYDTTKEQSYKVLAPQPHVFVSQMFVSFSLEKLKIG